MVCSDPESVPALFGTGAFCAIFDLLRFGKFRMNTSNKNASAKGTCSNYEKVLESQRGGNKTVKVA